MCDKLSAELEEVLGENGVLLYPSHSTPGMYSPAQDPQVLGQVSIVVILTSIGSILVSITAILAKHCHNTCNF